MAGAEVISTSSPTAPASGAGEGKWAEEMCVGQRFQAVDGFRGTVRFIGSVPGANPEVGWVGVEWDSASRGKHDGTFKGTRYFETSHPTAGSFLRPLTHIMPPLSFQDAFVKKYASEDAADAEEMMNFRSASKKKAQVVCELVGKDREIERMAKTDRLDEVTLPNLGISCAGDRDWLKQNAAGITSLMLDDNLFSNWQAVAELCSQLPNLTTLSISGNKLSAPPSEPDAELFSLAFSGITKLVLNATGVKMYHLVRLQPFLTSLTDLHLASNEISHFNMDDEQGAHLDFSSWPQLELIDLTDNLLSDWREVLRLSAFRCMKKVLLSGNQIESIHFTENPAQEAFPHLKLLAMANNKLHDWSSIDSLSPLPELTELRVQGNPFTEATGVNATRQLIIATLPNLKLVNGGEVRHKEHIEAEKFYIRYRLQRAEGATPEELSNKDPLFAKLVQVHGLMMPAQAAQGGGGAAMITVTLKSMAPESAHKKEVVRKLPGSMTVANVKRMCQNLFQLDVSKQRLFAKAAEEKDIWSAELMEEDLKPINLYIMTEETEIIMQELDEKVVAREQEEKLRKKKEQEEAQSLGLDAVKEAAGADIQAAAAAAAAAASASRPDL